MQDIKVKRTAKNSVFMDLFQDKTYLLALYQTLHPEDTTATEDSLTNITIENILTDNLYNDLGFIVHDSKLMVLIESQSTWSANILIRMLMYLAQSYHEYFQNTNQNLYKTKKVKALKPEFYIIYTGNQGRKPEKLSLSEEFFEGKDIDVEVKAKVLYETNKKDIINQYIIFCKVFNEQTMKYGLKKQAVDETIRICKDKNVLKNYLSKREKEVITIMMSLFDEEEIMKSFIRSERYEAAQEAREEAQKEAQETIQKVQKEAQNKNKERAILMLGKGKISLDEIQIFFPELSDEEIEEIKMEAI